MSFSSGWFDNFRKHFNLHNVKFTGECASADHQEAELISAELAKNYEDYDYKPQQVFNADETVHKEVMEIMQMARNIGGEGFSDLEETEVEELINSHQEELTEEEFMEMHEATNNESEDEDEQEEQKLTAAHLRQNLHIIEKVIRNLMEKDPNTNRSLTCKRGLTSFFSCKLFTITMRLVILDDYDLASEWAAKYICNRIIQFKPSQGRYFTLGLPTGSTPLGCYKKLIEYHKNGDLSFKYVKTFNMDEYVGLPRNHPESYHSYMWNNFFKHIDIDPNNAHILDGNALDLQAECDAFEKNIEEAGGIDLFVGGIGPDGHIAFNEPGSSLASRTRLKTLAMDTILANAKYFDGDLSKVPTMALTVGVGTVMDAREVMILITGAHKAFALYKAIEEGVNHMWTVSAFQQHPRTIFVCDEDATLELRVKTVKYFKGLMHVHNKLVDPLYSMKEEN
ncbi:hypothetical protein KIL84_000948 [Mauremys mutica]|uniref:Glucosamine-6-phosphate deaminase 2 n=2 Tax=Mauremys mutica TaxID=74926 RepID=A0A9D4AT94_9SAUR|nr:hypothetical protein KIL84_000948 [Mauremys mutica]